MGADDVAPSEEPNEAADVASNLRAVEALCEAAVDVSNDAPDEAPNETADETPNCDRRGAHDGTVAAHSVAADEVPSDVAVDGSSVQCNGPCA